jgi:alanine-glyoxylate transaminase/serine-glyoxylate transaminase/serine-pyruvate transaminase
MNQDGYWPYTPNTNLLYGLAGIAATCCSGQGLPAVFARHLRWAEGVRAAVRAWGLPIQCADAGGLLAGADRRVITPAKASTPMPLRKLIYERFDCSLGTGLGKVKGRMFRIGHLGDCNDLTLMAALSGCEMGLKLAGVRLAGSGVLAAMEYFAGHPMAAPSQPSQ